MRLILEAKDLIKIISKHFGEDFDEKMVKVSADPFEVELQGIPLTEAEPGSAGTQASKPPAALKPVELKPVEVIPLSSPEGFTGIWKVDPPNLPAQPDENIVEQRAGSGSTVPPPYSEEEMSGDAIGDLLRRSREIEEQPSTTTP